MSRASTRAVPVAKALRSLIPATPLAINPTPAQLVHQVPHQMPVQPVMAIQRHLAPPELRRQTSSQNIHWVGLVSSLAIVAALATVIIPHWSANATNTTGGRILGDSTSQPLHVTVSISQPDGTTQVRTDVATGTVAEALARAGSALDQDFTYTSRGDSIYLSSFDGRSNSVSGRWQVQVNGVPISDLSQVTLRQNDQLTVTWQ